MEEAIREAERTGAPEEEIAELMLRALEIARRVMDARKDKDLMVEEEMARRARRFARRLSGDDRAQSAS
ncbi:MAG: hypothetical protein M3R38_18080 [Actinomycetota bacterium]|nr:hypothetical protein [Actinomycetota bacterium]